MPLPSVSGMFCVGKHLTAKITALRQIWHEFYTFFTTILQLLYDIHGESCGGIYGENL